MTTLGTLIDQLITSCTKMYVNQDDLYEMRRMNFDEFKTKYFSSEEGAEKLWMTFKKACDLNVERSDIIDKIDSELIGIIKNNI